MALAPFRADIILFSCSLIWGVNVSVSALILRHLHPLTLATICSAASALVYAAITISRERDLTIPWRQVPIVLLPGILTIGSFAAYFYSLTRLTAATVALLFSTIPLFAVLLTAITSLQRLTWTTWLATILGLGGVALVVVNGSSFSLQHLLGDLEVLVAAMSAAAYTVALKPLSQKFSPYKLLAYVFGISAVGTAFIGYRQLTSEDWSQIPLSTWSEILASVLMAFIFAESAYIVAVTLAGPVRAALYSYLIPVFGVISARILLAASLSGVALAGGAVIIVALVVGRTRSPA